MISKNCESDNSVELVAGVSPAVYAALTEAALDCQPITGRTHGFYRYPARFSPRFAAAAIRELSLPGDLVLDPYMGGGTTIVEAIASHRRAVGNDLNSLAAFIAKVKITSLVPEEEKSVREWAEREVPCLMYNRSNMDFAELICPDKTRNLSLVKSRFIKKAIAAALSTLVKLPTKNAQDFARCVVLRVSQWALDGRGRHTPLSSFRKKLLSTINDMIKALGAFVECTNQTSATILNGDAAKIDQAPFFNEHGNRADLIVTSPPYPGVHVLYHRWQVDGRRETPAPYWIAGCDDGQGASYYNFGDRRHAAADKYFETSLMTLKAIRRVIRNGGYMVQMVAFNRPEDQLPRYLRNMETAGFGEVDNDRIWRSVPNRKWHATLKGKTHSSNEVVLIHRAI